MKHDLFVDDDGNFCLVGTSDDVKIRMGNLDVIEVKETEVEDIKKAIRNADKAYDKDKRKFVTKSEVLPKPKETDTMNPDNTKKK